MYVCRHTRKESRSSTLEFIYLMYLNAGMHAINTLVCKNSHLGMTLKEDT